MNIDDIITKIDPDQDYRIKDIAEMFGVSTTPIKGAVARGRMTARKVFGKWYIKGREVRDYFLGEK